jgi:hypothetical protein
MSPTHDELDIARQQAAEHPDAGSDTPDVAQYRRLYATLRQVPLPEAPYGFAQRLERAVRAPEPGESAERWGIRIGLGLLGLMLAAMSVGFVVPALPRFEGAPWRLLLIPALALAWMAFGEARARRPH